VSQLASFSRVVVAVVVVADDGGGVVSNDNAATAAAAASCACRFSFACLRQDDQVVIDGECDFPI